MDYISAVFSRLTQKIDVKHEVKITDHLSENLEQATRTFLAKRVEPKKLIAAEYECARYDEFASAQ